MRQAVRQAGKTALVTAAQRRAKEDGMRAVSARGLELERRFTFGVLRQLYEPVLHTVDDAARERLLQGAAAGAGPALGIEQPGATGPADPIFAVAHGIYWLSVNLAADDPLLVVIDDAQWAGTASLRCALYLAARLDDLPIVLLIAARPGEPGAPDGLLAGLFGDPSTSVLCPGPLSVVATRRLLSEHSEGEPDPAFAAAAHELTAGNPFFVTALAVDLREQGIAPDAATAQLLPSLTPGAVGRAVLVRLIRMGDDAVTLAQAVAVLGDDTPLPRAAALAGLDTYDAAGDRDLLRGGDGADTLTGGDGDDSVYGDAGSDAAEGGAGEDSLRMRDGEGDAVTCAAEFDTVIADPVDALDGCEVSDTGVAPPPVERVVQVPGLPAPPATAEARDDRSPVIALGNVKSSQKLATFKKGLKVAVDCDEPCSFEIELRGSAASVKLARAYELTLASRSLARGSGTRAVTLKPSRRLVGRNRRMSVQLKVEATDAAGNRATKIRTLKVR